MIAGPASRDRATSSVVAAVMPSGIVAVPPDAVRVGRLNDAPPGNTTHFLFFVGPRHRGGVMPGVAVARGDGLPPVFVASPHPVHSVDEISLIASPAGVARLDAFGADWYVHPPGSTSGPAVRGGAASALFPLPEGCIDTTQSAARGNAINQ
jgi:hypothetical protein